MCMLSASGDSHALWYQSDLGHEHGEREHERATQKRQAPEHRLHLQRRPRLSGHQRLQRPAPADRDAAHRPPGQGGDAVRPLRRAELDLRAQPGLGPDRQVLAPATASTTTPTAASTARRRPFPSCSSAAGYQTAIIGKWHLVTDPTGFDEWHILPGQGVYYNPPMIHNGQPRAAPGLHHRHHHRPLASTG